MPRWSMPIWRAARSTISSASPSRRCSGASCRARARPAACSRSRCGWSPTANWRSRSSSRANTGRWSRRSRPRATTPSRRASSAPTARRSSGSTSARATEAEQFKRDLETAQFSVASVEAKPAKRNPPPPFTTSTMQQEASRKLGFAPAHTMRIAQRLYEGIDIGGETVGLITYMRTDGVYMAPEAIAAIRSDDRVELRQAIRAGRRAQLSEQAEERAGSARSRAPDRRVAPPARCRQIPRCRAGRALRTDLAARGREPDGIGRDWSAPPSTSPPRSARACSTCAPPARSSSSTASSRSIRKARTTRPRTTRASACPQ